MAHSTSDIAVLGSTPLALLLAGLLAERHGRRVCLVASAHAPLRVPKRHDIALLPSTRPETIALLAAVAPEAERLIGPFGRNVVSRGDVVLVAESEQSAAALGHFHHLGRTAGMPLEPQGDRRLPHAALLRARGVARLQPDAFAAAARSWLQRAGVSVLAEAETEVVLQRDGSVLLTQAGREIEAAAAILADDAALLAHAGDLVERVADIASLSRPADTRLPHMAMYLDRGVQLASRPEGLVSALVRGDASTADARLASIIAASGPASRVAKTAAATAASRDGAPFVGRGRSGRATLVGGFGAAGAFLAPAIARHLAGSGSRTEDGWFAAHAPSREPRPAVADFRGFGR